MWDQGRAGQHVREHLVAAPSRSLMVQLAGELAFGDATRAMTDAVLAAIDVVPPRLPRHGEAPRRSIRWDDRGNVERIELSPFGGSVIEGYQATYALVLSDGTAITGATADDAIPVTVLDVQLRRGRSHDLAIVERALASLATAHGERHGR
jgi:hypothetical protein